MQLNKASIAALRLPEGKTDQVFFDDKLPGFGVRVRITGHKSWHVQYDVHGRTRRLALGAITILPLSLAREEARRILARVKLGEDPAAAKRQAREALRDTVGALVEPYLRFRAPGLRPGSLSGMAYHLKNAAKPLHAIPIKALERRHIAQWLDAIAISAGPIAANRARSTLSSFCRWCSASGYLDSNPVTYTPKRPEKAREKALSLAELRALWRVLGTGPYDTIVKLLILCGLRRAEVGDLRWDEVDLENDLLILPAARVKGKREHRVPLSGAAKAVLEALPRRAHPCLFGFGAKGNGFQDWSGSKAGLDARIKAAGHQLGEWRLHDLRRALSTIMNERALARPEVIEGLLGHSLGGVAGIYNRAEHLEPQRTALEAWALPVTGAEPEGRVVRLPPRSRRA